MNKHLVFQDLQDFWDYAFRESTAYKKLSRELKSEWSGDLSWIEAKNMALRGWQEGFIKVQEFQVKISPLITNKIFKTVNEYAVCGGSVDIGMFLANDPECFVSKGYGEESREGKIITLVCSISFSAKISPDTIIQRGAMICALVDAIEYAGYRVELICNWTVSTHINGRLEVDILLKKANQPLNMIEIAFCLAHPAMLRRMMFSIAEIEGWSDYAYCYGYPAEATNKGALYIQEIYSGMISDVMAIDWVLSELEKLGIKIDKN